MPRSLKKGPFVDDHLQKKVDAQNEKGTKNVIKTFFYELLELAMNFT